MSKLSELYQNYGEAVIQLELAQNKVMDIKRCIAIELNLSVNDNIIVTSPNENGKHSRKGVKDAV